MITNKKFEEMSDDERWDAVEQLEEQWHCEDVPEIREKILECNRDVSDEAKRIHEESIIIDACTFDVVRKGWRLQEAKATGLLCTVPDSFCTVADAFHEFIKMYEVVKSDSDFKLILTPEDILEAKKNKQTGLIIGSQSPNFVFSPYLETTLETFKKLGLRVMQIAYNFRTAFADGCFSKANAGLSDTGIELIQLMEKVGITVDLSHVGERSTLDSLEMATKPQIFSHSNPLALFNHPRNISDEQAKKCAKTGGVIGVSTYNVTLWDGKNFPTIDTFVDCLVYYCNLVGVDHVGVGMDTTATEGCYDRFDIMYFNKLIRKTVGNDAVTYQSFKAGRGYGLNYTLEGLMCLANWVALIDRMLKRGFTEPEIKKIAGENFLRVFKETW